MKYQMNCPPMGWNSYDYYDTTVNEAQVKANADFMAAHLKDAGWEYIVVDIQWYAKHAGSMRECYQYIPFGEVEMDDFGRLLPDAERFPSSANGQGFGPLAEYVHALGLKFGIHIMRGIPRIAAHRHLPVLGSSQTADEIADPASICGWNPDMYGLRRDKAGAQAYYDSTLAMYARWGVDFIKCDDICNTNLYPQNPYSAAHEIEMLQRAIQKTGREIVLSLSPGPALIEQAWHYEKYANMWRITDDFWDRWDLLRNMFDRCELWQNHVSAGAFPDCDMLPLGVLGKGFGQVRQTRLTHEEQRTMLTLWCVFGSPLMIGGELTKLDSWTRSLLQSKEVLRLVSSEFPGRQHEKTKDYAIWSCAAKNTDERFVALFNFLDTEQTVTCCLREVEQLKHFAAHTAKELWTGAEYTLDEGTLTQSLPPHGAGLFQIF